MAEKQKQNSSKIQSKNAKMKMNFLQTFREHIALFGFHPHSFNGRIGMGFLLLGTAIALMLVYLLQGPHDFTEYARMVSVIGALIAFFIAFAILSLQTDTLFQLTDTIESTCNGEKTSSMTISDNQLIMTLNHFQNWKVPNHSKSQMCLLENAIASFFS